MCTIITARQYTSRRSDLRPLSIRSVTSEQLTIFEFALRTELRCACCLFTMRSVQNVAHSLTLWGDMSIILWHHGYSSPPAHTYCDSDNQMLFTVEVTRLYLILWPRVYRRTTSAERVEFAMLFFFVATLRYIRSQWTTNQHSEFHALVFAYTCS